MDKAGLTANPGSTRVIHEVECPLFSPQYHKKDNKGPVRLISHSYLKRPTILQAVIFVVMQKYVYSNYTGKFS